MTSTHNMAAILEDLSSGRIDAAEAARRIDALTAVPPTAAAEAPSAPAETTPAEPATAEPTREGSTPEQPTPSDAGTTDPSPAEPAGDQDVWAAATDRPQRATVTTERFAPPPAPEPPVSPEPSPVGETRVNATGVQRISVRAVGRRVRIIGEPSVATLSADGPHVLRRNGAVLEVSSDGEMGASIDGFSLLRAPRSLDDIRSLGLGKELFLRVNPAIPVDVELTAGSLNTERVPHLGKVRVTAGAAKLLDVAQIDDALIQAGQATIKATITKGRSRVRAESGSLTIQLGDESDVTIKGDSQLGRVSWSGGHTGAGDEVVMGQGTARLDVEVVMGHAQVRVGSEPVATTADAPTWGGGA